MLLILCISSDAWLDFIGSIISGLIGALCVCWTINSSHDETTRQINSSIDDTRNQISSSNKQINKQIKNNNKHKRESIALICMTKINSCMKSGTSIYKNFVYLSQNINKREIKIKYQLLNSIINSVSKEYKSVNSNMSDLIPYYIIFDIQDNDSVQYYRTYIESVCLSQVFMIVRELIKLLNNVKIDKYGNMKTNDKILLSSINQGSKDAWYDMKIMNKYLKDLMDEFKRVGFKD